MALDSPPPSPPPTLPLVLVHSHLSSSNGLAGTAVGLNRKVVLVLPRDTVVLGALLAAHSHVLVVVNVPESVVDDSVEKVGGTKLHTGTERGKVVGDVGHRLEAPGELGTGSEEDVLGGEHGSLHPTATSTMSEARSEATSSRMLVISLCCIRSLLRSSLPSLLALPHLAQTLLMVVH